MSLKKKQEFDIWYLKNSSKSFEFKKELISYCDVEILRKGCMAFRKIIINQTKSDTNPEGIDPFRSSITIASLCHLIFRELHLEPETIAIIPENGFNTNEKTSKKAAAWLKFISKSQNISLQHAKNYGEIQIDNYRGDGFDPISNTVYEFHGCYYVSYIIFILFLNIKNLYLCIFLKHGCLKCFKPKTFNKMKQMSFEALNKRHEYRIKKIKTTKINDKSINLVECWEHDWDIMSKEDIDVISFLGLYEEIDGLKTRDAFFGGRTETFTLHWKAKLGEKAKYIDVTSNTFLKLYKSLKNFNHLTNNFKVFIRMFKK
jgi:hypothetical protein